MSQQGKKTSLLDIKFGELNDSFLEAELSPQRHSLSHRRTSTTSAWGLSKRNFYTADLVDGSDKPPMAIILRSTKQKRPLMTNSVQLLKANFNSVSTSEEVLVTEVPSYYTYKVWPLEYNTAAMKPPKSLSSVKGLHQGLINMSPDGFAELGSNLDGIPLPPGLVCEYRYGNKHTLSPIVLTRAASDQFQFPGVKMDDSWKGAILQTHTGVPSVPAHTGPKEGRLLLIGDSQTSSPAFRNTLKSGLKQKGITMHAQWRSGSGVWALGGQATADYWGVEDPYGKLFSAIRKFNPEWIVIELGGNDTRLYYKKPEEYKERLRLWSKLLVATGAKVYWFGPSYATQTGYDPMRQKIRNYQKEAFSSTPVTWFDMVDHTKGLTYKAGDPGVHFDKASYTTWAQRLLHAEPLVAVSHAAASTS